MRVLRETTAERVGWQALERSDEWRGGDTVCPTLDGHALDEPLVPKSDDDRTLLVTVSLGVSVGLLDWALAIREPFMRLLDERMTKWVRGVRFDERRLDGQMPLLRPPLSCNPLYLM